MTDPTKHSGVVSAVYPFPRRKGVFAVAGQWSGGRWAWQRFDVTQHRAGLVVGEWVVAGVENISRRPPLLLLERVSGEVPIEPGDVLTWVD